MGKKIDLFPQKEMKITQREARDRKAAGLLVQDPETQEQFRQNLERKKKRKEPPTLQEITERIKERILDTRFLEGLSSEGIGIVSSSKLTTYRGCHFAHLMQYILHLDPPIYFPNIVVGEKMHQVFEYFNKGIFTTEQEMLDSWKARWYSAVHSRNIYFREKKEPYIIFNLGMRTLRKFWEQEKDNPKPQFVEFPFGKEVILSYKIDGMKFCYRIAGKFDKIEIIEKQRRKKVRITDYKTGQVGEMLSDFDLQFTLYGYAYEKLAEALPCFPQPTEPDDLELIIQSIPVFSKEPKFEKRKAQRGEADLMYLVSEIHNADVGIRNKNFTPFMGPRHCDKICYMKPTCHELLLADNKALYKFIVSQYFKRIRKE